MKHIPIPKLPGARRLTPMEMNNLHFRTLDNHTPLDAGPGKKPTQKKFGS